MSEVLKFDTPAGDYKKICNCTIKKYKYPAGENISYDRKKDLLKGNKTYGILLKTVKVAAICMEISAVFAILFGILAFAVRIAVNITKPLFTGSFIIFFSCFAILVVLGSIGAMIEASADHEDLHKYKIFSTETAILNDGKIVIYGRTKVKGYQLREKGLAYHKDIKELENIEITYCFVIDKVKTLCCSQNGVLSCVASGTKRYTVFPYSPDDNSDPYNYYFHYKQKHVSSETLQWFDNLEGFSDLQWELENIRNRCKH